MGDTRARVVPAALQSVAWPKAVVRAHQAGASPHTGAPARPVDAQRRPWEIRDAADTDGSAELWLYEDIGGWGIWAEDLVRDLSRISAKSITVRINSCGGDVFDGIAIMNALIEHPADITIRVDGLAASIASVITLAGNRVIMGHSAQMMIHNASTMVWGEAADLRQTADLLEKISGVIAQAYADRTGTDPAEWQARMDAETWLTAQECVDLGLADEVAALPAREPSGAGHDPDPDNQATTRPAAAVPLRPAAAWPGVLPTVVDQVPAPADSVAPIDASIALADASVGGDPAPVAAATEPAEPTEPEDGPPGVHPDAAILAQALSWWQSIDQIADRMLAQISAALGVPNPDQDSDEPPPALPDGEAGLGAILGALTSADATVDCGQAILARVLGIPNPDPDASTASDGDDSSESAGVTDSATTAGPAPATTDTPGTGATAPTAEADVWADITASFTTPAPALAGAYTTKEGAWWL